MNNIHILIEHVVLNWPFLTETMNEKVVQALIQKFKEEAEDFSITISDDEIKKAITIFNTKFREDPNVPEKDLSNYSLKQLLKVVSSKPDFEKEKVTIVPTPDIVYNENGIVIYNGDVEGKCIRYGAGERWCITRGSFGNYRFDPGRGYPNFYLVRNTNLPDSDPLSFVAIQARNNGRYVYTNRKNSPHESQEMDFDKLLDEVPYLNSIDNVRSILKHIPISQAEINVEKRFKNGINFREWANDLDFEEKKLYISVRGSYIINRYSNNELFRDLSTDLFIVKVLPKYDKLAEWVFQNPWILGFDDLLKHVEIFKPNYQKSLLAKVNAPGHPINVIGKDILDKKFDFNFAKALVKTGKVPTDREYNLYVTKDGRNIINISYDRTGTYIDVITEEETYKNIKLSKRTQKYLFDYPNISDIPLDSLARAIQTNDLDNTAISGIIDKARTSNDTSKKIIKIGDAEVLFDTSGNRLRIYQVEGNSIIPADTSNENVIAAKNKFVEEASSNEEVQNNLITSIFNKSPLFNSEISSKILSNVPKSKLMRGVEGISTYDGNLYMFDIPSSFKFKAFRYSDETDKMEEIRFSSSPEIGPAYKQFLNDNNIKLDNNTTRSIFSQNQWQVGYKDKLALASIPDLPYTEDSTYRLKVIDNKIYIVNTANPAESFRISEKTGRVLQARAPRTTTPRPTPAQLGAGERVPAAGAGRRGRPAGGANRPIEGNISDDLRTTLENSNLLNSFNQLPVNIRAKFFGDSTRGNLNTDRGVSRRDNLLGNLGHVDYVRIVGPSAIYGIQLESGNLVASIVAQPGNSHWLLTQNGAFQLDSPANLVAALRQRNLTEIRNYIFNEYIERNPDRVDELKKHIEEIKNS